MEPGQGRAHTCHQLGAPAIPPRGSLPQVKLTTLQSQQNLSLYPVPLPVRLTYASMITSVRPDLLSAAESEAAKTAEPESGLGFSKASKIYSAKSSRVKSHGLNRGRGSHPQRTAANSLIGALVQ